MKKFFFRVKSLLIKQKQMKGKRVRLVMNPCGKTSSNNMHRGNGQVYIVSGPYDALDGGWQVVDEECLVNCSWVYEWEMELVCSTMEDLTQEMNVHLEKSESLRMKIEWMKETGATDFDENEYRVWSAISAMENKDLSKMEKVKLISSLLK